MEMTTAKTIAVFAIIVGCFAVLYPKIFHPMLLHAVGSSPSRTPETMMPQVPPHLRRPGQGGRGAPQGDDFAPHMRGGPHPGMRAAAEMKKQAAATQGSGKGMMSVVLPMYAVGIVIYLIYTMTKVFGGGKKNENEEKKDYMQSHFKEGGQGGGGGKRRLMVDDEAARQQQAPNPQENRKRQKDLERLLMKADKDKITELEMQQLKQRLLETEAQMSRILQAMETVAEKVEGQGEEQPPDVESLLKSAKERPTKLSDASPDLDSYDFVQRSSAEQSPVMVEDLGANEQDLEDNDDEAEEQVPTQFEVEGDYEGDLVDSEEEEDIDDIELEYDPSPDEAEPEEEEDCTEEIIGQNTKEVKKEEEEHPDLRKRQKQKQKVKRAD